MTETHFPLILDLVEWVNKRPRQYGDVMDAWRTSCPRLPVWEDTVDLGFVERSHDPIFGEQVLITEKGRQILYENGRGTAISGSQDHSALTGLS